MSTRLKEKFSEIILGHYSHVSSKEITPEQKDLMKFLTHKGYFRQKEMRTEVVVHEVPFQQYSLGSGKSEAVRAVAVEYDISERTIGNILRGKRHWID